MSKFLYSMFLMFAAQINPDIKDTDHYKEIHGVWEYMELSQQELEHIGFYIYEDMVNLPVFSEDSRITHQILDGNYNTAIDLYEKSDKRMTYKLKKDYSPAAVLDQNFKIKYTTSESKTEKLIPILVPANTKSGTKYFLYLFTYTKNLEKDLPENSNPEKYLRKLVDILPTS